MLDLYCICFPSFKCPLSDLLLNLSLTMNLSFHCPPRNDQICNYRLSLLRNTFFDEFGHFFIESTKNKLFTGIDVPSKKRKTIPLDILLTLNNRTCVGNIKNFYVIGMRKNKQITTLIFKANVIDPSSDVLHSVQYLEQGVNVVKRPFVRVIFNF